MSSAGGSGAAHASTYIMHYLRHHWQSADR